MLNHYKQQGPNTFPWGMSLVTLVHVDIWPITVTHWNVSSRNHDIHFFSHFLLVSLCCRTLSESFPKSKYRASPHSNISVHSSKPGINCIMHNLFCTIAMVFAQNNLYWVKYCIISSPDISPSIYMRLVLGCLACNLWVDSGHLLENRGNFSKLSMTGYHPWLHCIFENNVERCYIFLSCLIQDAWVNFTPNSCFILVKFEDL